MSAAYLNTRVSLFRERLWSEEQLAALIGVADAEMPGALRVRGLDALAAGYQDGDPRSLEMRIVAQLLAETRILLRPLAGRERQFLLYWIERFEVSNVKTLVRAKMAGERASGLPARLLDMGPFARLDAEDLMHAEDVTELLRRLERSPYAEIVRHARESFEENHDPFLLDATLDRAYYEGLVRRARDLEPSAGPSFRRLMADLVDRVNLVWLLRYRFNYGLPPAQVYFLLVGSHYRLHAALLRQMVTQSGPDAVLALLPAELARIVEGVPDTAGIAARLEREALAGGRRVLAVQASPIARAMAYMMLREANLRAVRGVLRGRRMGLPADAIQRAVVRPGAEAA